eukprot:11403428-Alexandrium_andersonii.AAC.1
MGAGGHELAKQGTPIQRKRASRHPSLLPSTSGVDGCEDEDVSASSETSANPDPRKLGRGERRPGLQANALVFACACHYVE